MDGGGRGRGKGEKTPARGDCWKAKHPSIVACHCIYGDEQVNELN